MSGGRGAPLSSERSVLCVTPNPCRFYFESAFDCGPLSARTRPMDLRFGVGQPIVATRAEVGALKHRYRYSDRKLAGISRASRQRHPPRPASSNDSGSRHPCSSVYPPRSPSLSTVIVPPCISTSFLAMTKPVPDHAPDAIADSTVQNHRGSVPRSRRG